MNGVHSIEEQARLVKCYVDCHTDCTESMLAALETGWIKRGGNLSRVVLLCASSSWFSFDWKHMVFTFHGSEPLENVTSSSESLVIRLNDHA